MDSLISEDLEPWGKSELSQNRSSLLKKSFAVLCGAEKQRNPAHARPIYSIFGSKDESLHLLKIINLVFQQAGSFLATCLVKKAGAQDQEEAFHTFFSDYKRVLLS